MYGRSRAEREWMADVAAQMIRDEILDDEDLWGLEELKQGEKVVCDSCNGTGIVTIGDEDESEDYTCEDCEGTGLVEPEE